MDVQNCETVAPCTDDDSVARLTAYNNASLFMEAREECGDTLDAIAGAMVSSCIAEFQVQPGCQCATKACEAALQPLVAQKCKRAILRTVCKSSDWLEPQLGANVRSIYLHVLNDCALGSPEGCSADNFDESLCIGLPTAAPAPAESPGIASSPRFSENLTALFNQGPSPVPFGSAPEPAETLAVPSALDPDMPMLPTPSPAPAEPPMPTSEATSSNVSENRAEAPDEQSRDGSFDPQVSASAQPVLSANILLTIGALATGILLV